MNKTYLVILMLFSVNAFAFDLNGKWTVDAGKTAEFNLKHIKMTELRSNFFKCSLKHTSLFFADPKMGFRLDAHDCSYKKKIHKVEAIKSDYSYKVIFENKNQTVISTHNPEGDDIVELINWVNDGEFWVNSNSGDITFRYFYKKSN
jgi:hypothetical protein